MKKTFLIISIMLYAVLFNAADVRAEKTESKSSDAYQTKQDISYRKKNLVEKDAYIKERCRLDVYYPVDQKGYATVVWFHGGGLTGGERFVPTELQQQGLAVVAVNYRLSPKVNCPTYIDDAAAAVAWTFKHIAEYGGDPDKIFVSGHSAGGYLTSMVGLDKRWLAKYDVDADDIAGLIPFSGHTITHFTVRKERGIPETQPIIDEFAPLYHVRPDAPPLVLITGDRELEILGRYEENAYLMRMMKVAGHEQTVIYELQGFDHGGMVPPAHSILLKHINDIAEM
ncbi:MAG: alpha/beta hydrolase [Planctomycetota bacterium]|jgi:acetyl esterase/lipase